jgi:MarR family transcriptional regulator, organic hydroperoxide resistance regulator
MAPGDVVPRDGGGLGYALTRAAQVWRQELTQELLPLEITAPQFFILAALYHMSKRNVQPTQREISERTAIDPNTASQVIRALESRGLIERTRHPNDSRAIALQLTNEGRTRAKASTQRARALNERFFRPIQQSLVYTELRKLYARPKEQPL